MSSNHALHTDGNSAALQPRGQLSDYEIFMAEVLAIGHDKRGNTLYRRKEDGIAAGVTSKPALPEFCPVNSSRCLNRRLVNRWNQIINTAATAPRRAFFEDRKALKGS